MTKFQGAVVKEQGITFAIIIVKSHVLNSKNESVKVQQSGSLCFPGVPIILMAQNGRGVPTYFGRPDIVKFLANIDMNRIPWQEYTFR